MPSDARDVTTASGDLDGDGLPDKFATYHVPTGEQEEVLDEPGMYVDEFEPWRMRAELATGAVSDEVLTHWDYAAEALGAVDVNGDDRAEVWINPREGATAHFLGLVVLDGCRLEEVSDEAGRGVRFRHYITGIEQCCATVGLDCADIDGDGRSEIVETIKAGGHDPRNGETVPRSWSYEAYVLEGDSVRRVGGEQGLSTKPDVPLRFSDGLRCKSVGSWF